LPLTAGLNPWADMWSQPRSTIRALTSTTPSYGIYYLATLYVLQSFFFYCNWWSIGLRPDYPLVLTLGALLSPLAGFIWLHFVTGIYYLTGRLLRGDAPFSHLRTAMAWSSIPFAITLLMWLLLICLNVEYTFIQEIEGSSSLFIYLISGIVSCWSLVLLIQCLREIQQFSVRRALFNVFLSWLLSSLICFSLFSLFHYLFL
jgi:hypothetical protein